LAAAQASMIHPAMLGTTIMRTPSLDSAVIKSDRLGGNFAYEVHEGHAYAAVTPVISQVPTPVGINRVVVAPATYKTVQQAPVLVSSHALPINGLGYSGINGLGLAGINGLGYSGLAGLGGVVVA